GDGGWALPVRGAAPGRRGRRVGGRTVTALPAPPRSLRGIPRERRALVRELQQLDPRRTARVLVFFAIWTGAALVAVRVPVLGVRLVCYFLMGATIQGLVILMHEGVHRILFRDPLLNRWVAFACGLPAFLSVTAYRVGPLNAWRTSGRERRDVLVEYGIIAGVFAAAFALVPIDLLLHVWVFPALVARQLTNVRTLAEHVLTGHGDRVTATRTVTSNRFVSFFMCNLNYH